ncbi:PD-(D/E)XK nuclease superfamily protein [Breznakibacter xylanolyticus]|uniref:PD-(D/E)XK nuclease superfamily protein n=1 Tax=Breznakibacter xylanolyticus TaxID=990 RepID=A0A2W7NLD6_9BACT|nr:PD-(D/E)XK nuclease family protein [Breznakibacter xylanolyticus]PZX20323.1 PD-(D/E)XK nuclease superfamily protein [Breznakibacter xylanolyticus]
MNDYFLRRLADYYYQQSETNISDICFVFPGRRAGIFFTNYLSQMSRSPMWSPVVLTINEFVEQLHGGTSADAVTLLFELYEVYCATVERPLPFDEFMPWGETLLSDFEDVDKYLVDAAALFVNLTDIKKIESDYTFLSEQQVEAIRSFWSSFNPERLSEHQKMFLRNWESIYPLYRGLNESLTRKQLSTTGMQVRHLVETIRQKQPLTMPWPKVVFAGFFVLTPAEKELFRYMQRQGADFFWDYSPWLLPKAGSRMAEKLVSLPFNGPDVFLRENTVVFPSPDDWEQPLVETWPEITITGVASPTEQLRVVSHFLEQVQQSRAGEATVGDTTDTAVLLTDENMLIPVLHAIPPAYSQINVTLGYPLKNTPIYGLVGALLNLQKNARSTREGKTWFYFRDVLPVLQHQYITAVEPEKAVAVKNTMLKRNTVFVEASELHQSDYLVFIFQKIQHGGDFPKYIETILLRTYDLIRNREQSYFEQEFIFALYKSVVRLGDLLTRIEASVEPETWLRLFRRITETQTVAFKGEPLSGLQVMGVLETRALDFENMVILNLNEGVFPKDSAPNSFVPYNLRRGFGLPTIEHQDAIFSYYFFRLLHRAKRVQLVYHTSTQGLQTGEMSRLLYQLIYESPQRPVLQTAVEQVKLSRVAPVTARKNEAVMQRLAQFTQGGERALSPSALSLYLECPLRFYYKQIAGIAEPDEISEDLDARIFGILFHYCLEKLLTPYVGQVVSADVFARLSGNNALIRQTIQEAFVNEFSATSGKGDELGQLQGKNILVAEVLHKYIVRFLVNEQQHCPLVIRGLEKRVAAPFAVNDQLTVNIGGIIDRMDETGGYCRVMDYKTGSGKAGVGELSYLFDPGKCSDYKAIFQTLLYSWVVRHSEPVGLPIHPSVVWLKQLFEGKGYGLTLGKYKNTAELTLELVEEEFADGLRGVLEELYNPEVPFVQTREVKKCEHCTYKGLCRRG